MTAENQMMALRLALAAFYAGGLSAMLRRADIWFPFTPTFTATPGKWFGWQDALRTAFSGIFLILLPAFYFFCVLAVLAKEPAPFTIHLTPPNIWDIMKFVVIMSLIAPQLGFYDLWQVLMRSLPDLFYSTDAKKRIQEHYPNAFLAGYGSTVAWGLGWICFPTIAFIFILWIENT